MQAFWPSGNYRFLHRRFLYSRGKGMSVYQKVKGNLWHSVATPVCDWVLCICQRRRLSVHILNRVTIFINVLEAKFSWRNDYTTRKVCVKVMFPFVPNRYVRHDKTQRTSQQNEIRNLFLLNTEAIYMTNLQFYLWPISIWPNTASFHKKQWRTQEFFSGGVQQIQLRTEDRTGIWGAVAPSQGFWRYL